MEDLVWNEVLKTFKDSYLIKEQFKKQILSKRLKEKESPLNQIKSYEKLISKYQNKIEQFEKSKLELFEKKLTLKLTEEQYERLEKSIDSEIDNCNQLILEKENEIDSTKNGVVWFDWLEDFKNHYNKIKDIKSIDQKRDFIRQFVEKIKVYWDKETKTHKLIITFRLKIVKDKRIRREKYVYKVQNGQTDKVISNFNSIKYKRLLKKKKESNLLVDSYSTVTDFAKFLG